MKRYVYDGKTLAGKLLRIEDAEPECGKDFCDVCGDCLHCYGDDPCLDQNGLEPNKINHFWVVYEDKEPR